MANRWWNSGNSERLYFLGLQIIAEGDCGHKIKKRLLLGRKTMTNLDSILKSRDITLMKKFCIVKGMVFSCNIVRTWELDHKEGWALKTWCFRNVLEKTLESLLDSKEIQPVHPKGNQSWIFIGRADAEGEAPILWWPNAKNWLIGKDPDAGKHWKKEEKGMTADEILGRHHWLNGHELEQSVGVGDRLGSLVCCNLWGRIESDRTEWLNWTKVNLKTIRH